MTTRLPRRIKPSMTYRMPQDVKTKISEFVESGEYANQADAITAGLRFWLDYRHFDVRAAVREYLQSEEGIELVRTAARKHRQKK